MNNEDFVSYELAKALKKAGFDWDTDSYYGAMLSEQGEMLSAQLAFEHNDEYEFCDYHERFSAPTLAQAQKWLRDVKDYIIVIYPSTDFTDSNDMCVPFLDGKWLFELWVKAERISLIETASEDYPTYESALSAGIEAALKLIEEGEE